MEEGKFRESAFYVKSGFPNPPAKTLALSRLTGNLPIPRVQTPKSVISRPYAATI